MAIHQALTHWTVQPRNRDAEQRLIQELGVPSIVAALLVQRGYADPEDANRFLNPRLDDLFDPRLLPDYAKASAEILGARERKELIFVHGDYDVDGVTSAALFNRFLSAIGCQVKTHVPHRMREGYGIHRTAVDAAREAGAKLFLTCDVGISAHEQVAMAGEAGMRVVVTDHHSIGHDLPAAQAIVNPHREDSEYPFDELSGVGVVFKLCAGLTQELGLDRDKYYRAFLDLAALGTIADVMPLVSENRIIAKFGLERLADTKKVGLQALMREAKISVESNRALRAYHVGFVIGPRLNAAGRIDDAAIALKLLLENDPTEAASLARKIEEVNTARKLEQNRTIEEASTRVLDRGYALKNVILVEDPSWHAGIVGIVAGRLVEQFRRPTFVLTVDPETGICKGSARTIPKFHLADAIRAFPDLFLSGGGHAMAAGCSFHIDKIDQIRDSLHHYAAERLLPEDFVPTISADVEVGFDELTMASAEALERLEPFGAANPEPLFVARGVTLAQVIPTKSPQHAKVSLKCGDSPSKEGIAFNIGERLAATGAGEVVDMILQPAVEEWRGNRSLKIHLKDYQIPG